MNISLKIAFPLIGTLLLAACETPRTPETADVANQGIPPTIKVTTSEERHLVFVGSAKKPLSDQERASLAAFVSDMALGSPGALHVRVRGTAGPDQIAAVTRVIAASGVEPTKIEVEAGASPVPVDGKHPGQPVEVVATVSRVDYPNCPRVSLMEIGGVDNPTSSNYGCSQITNLEAQVVDPRDLVQGESGGATDAQITNAAIDRLRTDKIKKAETVTISQVGGNGGQ